MNNKITLALLTGLNKEKGFTTVLALTCGLVATAVAVTMIAKGQSNQVNAMSQKATTQVSAIADVGIARTQALFLQIPELATTAYDASASQNTWVAKVQQIDTQYPNGFCGKTNFTQKITNVITTANGGYVDAGGIGEFKIKKYEYTDGADTGTLTLEARTKGQSTFQGKTQIKVGIPIDNTQDLGNNPPGLWVSTFNSGDNISSGAEYVDANVVTRDCTLSGSGFDISKNLAANKIAIAAPTIPFPPLPALPTNVIKQVTNLDNLAATCPSTTKLASNPEEANWIAQVYQNLQNFVIAPANAQTVTEQTITLPTNSTTFTITVPSGYKLQTPSVSSGSGTVTNNNQGVITYTYTGDQNITTDQTATISYKLTKNKAADITGTLTVKIEPTKVVTIPDGSTGGGSTGGGSTGGGNSGGGNSGGGSSKTVTLPGPCAEYSYNSTTKTYDFLVSSIDMKGNDDLKVDLTGAAGGGKAVRIFVQGDISFRGNADGKGSTNTLQIFGSNATGVNTAAVNYALPGDTTKYTTNIVEFKGTSASSGFLYAPAAKGSVAGGGNQKDGIWTGTLWINTWKAQSNNAKAIVTEGNFDWSLFPQELQDAVKGKIRKAGVESGLSSYTKEAVN